MKKINAKSIMIMTLSLLLVACNRADANTFKIPSNDRTKAYGLAGRAARREYNGLLATSIGSLNYLQTQEANNAQHFANFIDGLLVHNEYGVLEKNLAEKVERNSENTEFTFTVRKGVKWQKYNGEQYTPKIKGVETPQFVLPSDWVTTAKTICSYQNASDLKYLVSSFVKGAEEYYQYTRILIGIAKGESEFKKISPDDPAAIAKKINELIKRDSPTIWTLEYDDGAKQVEADDIAKIKDLSRFGVKADDEKMTLTYTLNQSASYFPTLFTYSCYFPTNATFLEETKFVNFGTEKDLILYNGPYLLKQWDTGYVTYVTNPGYWNVENTVTVETVKYTVIQDTSILTDEYTRQQFESGKIDGFSLNKKDVDGWRKYITGNNNEGNYENPVSPLVNSRLLDTIGNMYGSNLVLARDKVSGRNKSYYTGATADTVNNTARALRLADVRRAILDSYDMNTLFDVRYENLDEELRQQEKVWTYVPKGFVIDDNGRDYLAHYYDVYAQKKGGLTAGDIDDPQPGTAAYELKPGQTATKTLTQEQVNDLLDRAKEAIRLFNAENPSEKITTPINLELYSLWFDSTSQNEDKRIIANLNTRLNYGNEGTAEADRFFNVVPTDKVQKSDYETVSRSGNWDLSTVQWGWGADYGDPLTFMNTYRKGGDWADVFPYVGDEYVDNYELNSTGTGLEKSDLLADYTELVRQGASQTEDINSRYNYFAQAEYMLIEELGIYKPQTNNGQGWSLSVSRSAGYFMPTASYGLSGDRLTGWYILQDVMTREERNKARAEQAKLKEAYVSEHGSINIYD